MSETGTIYLRNLHGCETRVNLTGGRKVELKPRGQRGDMASINAEEQKDQKYIENIGLVFEPLSEEDAQAIIEKQNTNRNEPHAPFAAMTNQLGEKYTQAEIEVTESFEEQGEVVGRVESKDGLKNLDVRQDVVREGAQTQSSLAPEKVQVPGSTPADSHFADKQAKENPADYLDTLRGGTDVTETKGA